MPDVVIIGGGIIGANCASELARRGADVTLIERDELAAHASGRNQGLWVLPDDEATVPMAQVSLARYLEVARDAPLDIQLDPEPIGQVTVARDDAELRGAHDAVALAEREGTRVEPLSAAALAEVEPAVSDDVEAAWLMHSGHRLDPGALTVALALDAAGRGATIRHHLQARALARRGDRVIGAVTDEGVIEAPTTIVAGGPWSWRLLDPLGVRLPVTGARGWLIRVAPTVKLHHLVRAEPATEHRQGIAPPHPKAAEVAAGGVPPSAIATVLHPHRDGTVLVGSSRQIWLTPEPEESDVVPRMLGAAIRLVPSLADAEVLSTWWGIRPLSPDERPFVGPVAEGLHVATGHGSEGVILGAGTAQLVAAQLGDETPPFDPAPYDPFRFA